MPLLGTPEIVIPKECRTIWVALPPPISSYHTRVVADLGEPPGPSHTSKDGAAYHPIRSTKREKARNHRIEVQVGAVVRSGSMQDCYVGDIGDFGKYGLLRSLCGGDDYGPALRLGVLWYKFDGRTFERRRTH